METVEWTSTRVESVSGPHPFHASTVDQVWIHTLSTPSPRLSMPFHAIVYRPGTHRGDRGRDVDTRGISVGSTPVPRQHRGSGVDPHPLHTLSTPSPRLSMPVHAMVYRSGNHRGDRGLDVDTRGISVGSTPLPRQHRGVGVDPHPFHASTVDTVGIHTHSTPYPRLSTLVPHRIHTEIPWNIHCITMRTKGFRHQKVTRS